MFHARDGERHAAYYRRFPDLDNAGLETGAAMIGFGFFPPRSDADKNWHRSSCADRFLQKNCRNEDAEASYGSGCFRGKSVRNGKLISVSRYGAGR